MSGGTWNYKQWQIQDIREHLELELERQGKPTNSMEEWEEKEYPIYPEMVQKIFKDAIKYLKLCEIYTHYIDYYLASDIGEETLVKEIRKRVNEIE